MPQGSRRPKAAVFAQLRCGNRQGDPPIVAEARSNFVVLDTAPPPRRFLLPWQAEAPVGLAALQRLAA